MINLIGPDKKKEFLAARRNTIWRRYILILISVLVAMTLVLAGALWLLLGQISASQAHVQENESKRDAAYNKTKLEAEAFRAKLSTAKTILNGETSYSELLIDLANTIPSGSILSSITLSQSSFDTDQSLSFKSKTNNDVLALKTALEQSDLFSNVNILTTTEDVTSETPSPYPINVTINAKLKKPAAKNASGSEKTP